MPKCDDCAWRGVRETGQRPAARLPRAFAHWSMIVGLAQILSGCVTPNDAMTGDATADLLSSARNPDSLDAPSDTPLPIVAPGDAGDPCGGVVCPAGESCRDARCVDACMGVTCPSGMR